MECKIFPYIHIRGGQARPRWTRQTRQLPCRLTQTSSGIEMESLACDIVVLVSLNAQQKLTGSLGSLATSYMDEFILLPKLPLS